MKKFIIFCFSFLLSQAIVFPQNFISNEHSYLTELVFNPAIAGSAKSPVVIASVKKNWLGLQYSPTTCMLNTYSSVEALKLSESKKFIKKASNVGIGLGFYNDINGPVRTTGMQMAYSYRLILDDDINIFLGLAAKLMFYNMNHSILKYNDYDDPLIISDSDNKSVVNFNFGSMLEHPKFNVGFACTNLADFNDKGNAYYYLENIRNLYLSGKYKFNINNSLLEPSVLFRKLRNNYLFDFSIKYDFVENFRAGIGYGTPDFWHITVITRIDRLSIGYLYEFSSAPLYNYAYGNHLIYTGINF